MRVIGVDLGARRIGVAVSDVSATLASPLTTVLRSGDPALDHARLAAIVAEEGAERMIVGLPLSLDGSMGRAARAAVDEARALAGAVGVPVETYDERFTTVSAHQVLQQRDVRGPARRRVVDQVAAAIMLQAWLDGASQASSRSAGPGPTP